MQLDVFDQELKKVGSVDVPDAVFAGEVKEALLWEQCKAQRASARAGTHATKTRANVSGGGAKPFKQKGTGRARQGSSRAPNHVGGGVVFGPQPRPYAYRLPKGGRRAALRSALSLRAHDKALLVLEDFALEKPQTKAAVAFCGKAQAGSLLICDVANGNLRLSVRNLRKTKFLEPGALNVFDIIRHQKLAITRAALGHVIERALKKGEATQAA